MKIFALFFTFIYISLTTFSQEKFQLVTGFLGSFEKEVISNKGSQVYGALGLNLGTRFSQAKGDLDVSLIYQFSSNVVAYKSNIYPNEEHQYIVYNSVLRSHFSGLSLKYTFNNKDRDRKIKPFIFLSTLTEITSNYKKGYLLDNEFIPKNESSATYYYPSIPGGEYTVDYYYSNFYHSTPLASSLLGGIDIKLNQNLSLNIAAGYAFRVMKVKYAEWKENEDVYKKLETIPTENVFSHFLDVQLGLSYAFPLKKTSKLTNSP
ncbi:MAG TPA: hypothetical protein VL021_08725 [Brumimicrobium sp.]|nr:hypothetical protein [Brumimicrobium sp.]